MSIVWSGRDNEGHWLWSLMESCAEMNNIHTNTYTCTYKILPLPPKKNLEKWMYSIPNPRYFSREPYYLSCPHDLRFQPCSSSQPSQFWSRLYKCITSGVLFVCFWGYCSYVSRTDKLCFWGVLLHQYVVSMLQDLMESAFFDSQRQLKRLLRGVAPPY